MRVLRQKTPDTDVLATLSYQMREASFALYARSFSCYIRRDTLHYMRVAYMEKTVVSEIRQEEQS